MADIVEPSQVLSVVDRLVSLARRSASQARSRIAHLVRRATEVRLHGKVIGIDTAFPQSPVEFMGFSVSAVSIATVVVDAGKLVARSVDTKVVIEAFGDIDPDYVVGYARLLEREKAAEKLDEDTAMLVLDGEIMPYRAVSEDKGLWGEVRERTLRLIKRARELDVDLVGVVKRSFSKTLAKIIGINVSDRVVSTFLLQRGEYIVLDHPLLDPPCRLVYYKPIRGPDHSVKLEVCGIVNRVIGFLVKESGPTGLPWIIDVVDSLAKNSVTTTLRYLEAVISSRTARRELPQLGLPANLQERRGEPGSA